MILPDIQFKSTNQTDKQIFDLLIIGAGGAGMNLLLALVKSGYTRTHRVGVVEPNEKVKNDRTWCFWAHPDDDIVQGLNEIISTSWTHILINGVKKKSIAPLKYYHIKGKDFYDHVKEQLLISEVEWVKDEVEEIVQKPGSSILRGKRDKYQAYKVFDSRLNDQQIKELRKEEKLLWQSFYGYKVSLQEATFDKDTMTMMSFNVDQAGGTQFMYVLPFSEKEGLIELTRFSPQLINLENAALTLDKWIKDQYGSYNLLETEIGRIPMTDSLNKSSLTDHHSIFPIGTAAGAIKSSTGYAFKRMYNHAQLIARALKYDFPIPQLVSRPRSVFYDKILLYILKRQPKKGKLIFARLFEKVKLNRVLRFLDEETKLLEELSILTSLPFLLFIKAFIHVHFLNRFRK